MKYFLLIQLLGLFLLSCCTSDENLQLQSNSKYEGEYVGFYDGGDKGEMTFKITDAGNIVGNLKYNNSTATEEFLGFVQVTGTLSANTRSGFVFNGQITNFENSIGQWTKKNGNEILKGNFTIQKK